ncbi:MAG: hypothetical protein AAFU65_00905 [Pseudomonadota bacterium]
MKIKHILGTSLILNLAAGASANTTVDDLFRDATIQPDDSIVEPDCGSETVATVVTKDNDLYLFCSDAEGKTAVIEVREDRGDETLIDESMTPSELLRSVVPKGVEVPKAVLKRLETCSTSARATAWRVGEWDLDRVARAASNSRGTCSAPSLGMSPTVFFNNTTYCGWVGATSAGSHNPAWHAHGASYLHANNEGSPNHAGPHLPPYEYYYADEDELGDARYARARVRSCGGKTRLRSWVKASATSGSWSPKWDWEVPSGYVSTMAYYANSQHSLWMGYDADDVFFRADAIGSASFGSRFYFLKYGWGENCDMKF